MFTNKTPTRPKLSLFYLALALLIPIFLLVRYSVIELPTSPIQPTLVKFTYERKEKPLPQCANQGRAKSFIIMFIGNSGSTALMSELSAHPQTEIREFEYIKQEVNDSALALEKARTYFKETIAKGLTPGYKMRPIHINRAREEWIEFVKEFDTRIIWNYRKNVIKSTLTEYVKFTLKDSSNIGGMGKNISQEERCKIGAGCRYTIDVEKFHYMANVGIMCNNEIASFTHIMDNGRRCVWELPYEDYLHHREATIEEMQRFLGFDIVPTQPSRYKGTSDNLCDAIENYDQLCERMYGCTIWQPMLEDQINDCYCRNYVTGPSKCDIVKQP